MVRVHSSQPMTMKWKKTTRFLISLDDAKNLLSLIESAAFLTMNKDRAESLGRLRLSIEKGSKREERRQRQMNHEQ